MLPARVESFARFAERAPRGTVLVPTGDVRRTYGRNPYAGYDSTRVPFLYRGEFPKGIALLAYVLAVGKKVWALDLIRKLKLIEDGDLVITWEPGQNSALDRATISKSRDSATSPSSGAPGMGWWTRCTTSPSPSWPTPSSRTPRFSASARDSGLFAAPRGACTRRWNPPP